MSILDSLTSCIWFNPEYQRNTLSSMLAGVLVMKENRRKKKPKKNMIHCH